MKILAVQSAIHQGSVALLDNATGVNIAVELPLTKRLSTSLAPAIEDVLEEADWRPEDIGLFACAKGPGSFTGLRVGMALAKGFAMSVGCAIKAVPTMDIIRYSFGESEKSVIAIMDARSHRIYYAEYRKTLDRGYLTSSEPELASVKALLELVNADDTVIGPDADFLSEVLEYTSVNAVEAVPDALTLAKVADARLGRYGEDDPAAIAPIYLKTGQVG
ncbi:MAG: tRNA (adenosine(37)-N6)-threonylcarbamoyltransferase complex dimerization subunit type 1 TsaB [bacterium]|nr:tRNA (adenosine(37)-N6)-threonylcarbamoyltransferase complex dimerization subunit type 1 TsaB [bacterium]